MTTRGKLWIVCAVVLLVCALVPAIPGIFKRYFGPPVISDALVGQTESQIAKEFGRPDKDWPQYEPLGLRRTAPNFRGPTRTVIFHPRGRFHPEGGTLWVWFRQEGNEWICFESCWFADGVVF